MLKSYNSQELIAFAQRLLAQATAIMLAWTLLGVLIAFVGWKISGAFAGTSAPPERVEASEYFGTKAPRARAPVVAPLPADVDVGLQTEHRLAACALVVLVFFAVGRERGLLLRVRAQELLCQVSIEQHARETAVSMARLASTVPEPRPRA